MVCFFISFPYTVFVAKIGILYRDSEFWTPFFYWDKKNHKHLQHLEVSLFYFWVFRVKSEKVLSDIKLSSISILKFLFISSTSLHISICYLPAAASCSVPSLQPPTDPHISCTLYSLCCPTEPYRGARAAHQAEGKAGRTGQMKAKGAHKTVHWCGVQASSLLCAEKTEILSQHSDNRMT